MRVKDLLLEVFDNPWEKTHDDEMTVAVKNHINDHKGEDENFGNIHAYKLEGDNGHLISYDRNGMMEVHHIDKNQESGMIIKKKNANPRFISTMIDHLKTNGLDKGRSVRIVSPLNSKLSRHYAKFVDYYAKKHGHKIDQELIKTLGDVNNSIVIHPLGFKRLFEDGWN